jgi:hypothetical protein
MLDPFQSQHHALIVWPDLTAYALGAILFEGWIL